jgi:hypothetical protein
LIHERILIDFPLILRSELLAQYGSHPTASTSAAPVPSTSSSSLPISSIPDAVASTSSASIFPAGEEGNNSLADLSLSQIDPGVLAELPAYLQAEIRSHYTRGPPAALAADSGTAPPTNSSSPAKKLNVKKAAGTVAKRRGRPPKNSVKAPKNTVQKPGKENDAEVANLNNNSKVQHGVIENVRLPEMSEESQSSRDSRSCQTADSQGVGGRSPRPTFCGKTSVADIRPLIKVIDFSFHRRCGFVTFWSGSGSGSEFGSGTLVSRGGQRSLFFRSAIHNSTALFL